VTEPSSAAGPAPDAPRSDLPWIKQMPSRRGFDLLLLIPFVCVGASIGTLALFTGVVRHLALVFAFISLICWVRAGSAPDERGYSRWLLFMFLAVFAFLGCGVLSWLG
jgi:hypothetical protein